MYDHGHCVDDDVDCRRFRADPARRFKHSRARCGAQADGDGLRAAAALIRGNIGLEAIQVDRGGWDHHDNMGPNGGLMYDMMVELAQALLKLFEEGRVQDLPGPWACPLFLALVREMCALSKCDPEYLSKDDKIPFYLNVF